MRGTPEVRPWNSKTGGARIAATKRYKFPQPPRVPATVAFPPQLSRRAFGTCTDKRGERTRIAMRRIEASVEIDAPIADVFTYASDGQRWEDGWEGVSNFRPTTEVTRGNGARYAYKARMAGNIETEIHEFGENVGWIGVATKGLPHRIQWVFAAIRDKTRLSYIQEYDLPWPVLGPILDSLLVRPGWQRILEHSLRNQRLHFKGPKTTKASEGK